MRAPKWHLRLENLRAMLSELRQARDLAGQRVLSDLEKAGVVQQYKIALEQAWKAAGEFLQATGSPVEVPVTYNIIRAAFDKGVIADGDLWFRAIKERNKVTHEYGSTDFEQMVRHIWTLYLPMLEQLEQLLGGERDKGN